MKTVLNFIFCVALCFALVSCCNSRGALSQVNVSGKAKMDMKADIVRFYVRISETENTTKEAQNKTNEKVSQILEILKSNGIKDEDIKTQNLDISTDYQWESGKQIRIGETVSQSLSVTLRNMDNFGTIIDEIGTVSGVSVYSISFDVSDKTAALEKVRTLAFEDAKSKAESYCESAGTKLGKVISINEGYSTYNARAVTEDYAIESPVYAMKASGVATAIPSGTLSVEVNVDCVFRMKYRAIWRNYE